MSTAVFAYGSLVSAASAAETLGSRSVTLRPAVLRGWRRSFSLGRDNRRCEKTFARSDDGTIPELILALNLEPADPEAEVNGALIETDSRDLGRLDRRELRYDRIEVSDSVTAAQPIERVFIYVAKPENQAPVPPSEAVILGSYERAVERAFAALGPGQLEAFRATTTPCPAERVEAELASGRIPAGNPRAW
jgi:cation transport regulator ChaC